MKQELIRVMCDICKELLVDENKTLKTWWKEQELQIIFLTEQNEGRSSYPHLSIEKLDVCADCYGKILNGKAVYATGAQGYNNYFFKKELEK